VTKLRETSAMRARSFFIGLRDFLFTAGNETVAND